MFTLRNLSAVSLLLFMEIAMAEDTGKHRGAGFIEALLSTERHRSIPAEMDIYAPLLGSWRIAGTEYTQAGDPEKVAIEVEFARVLNGRAIQDVWVFPVDKRQPLDAGNRGSGTTLRLYDPEEKSWNVVWLDPVGRKRAQLTGRSRGDEIVQIGANESGQPRRWIFSDITGQSFVWRGEHSDDGGRTWTLNAEYFAMRVHR